MTGPATLTPTARRSAPPPPSVALTALLDLLYADLNPDSFGLCVIGAGRGREAFGWRLGSVPRGVWPPKLVSELNYTPPPELHLCAATFDQHRQAPREARVLWAEVPQRVTEPHKVKAPAGSGRKWIDEWSVQPEDEAAARAGIAAFPLPPSFIVNGGWALFPCWRLAAPLALDGRTLARVQAVQRALATAIGGRTDTIRQPVATTQPASAETAMESVIACDILRAALPVPGSTARLGGGATHARVRLELFDAARAYDLTAIEEAAAAAAKGRV
jgi:hypothetical protein